MLLTMSLSPNRRLRAAKTDRAWNRKDQSYSGFEFIGFKCWLSWIRWWSSLSFEAFRISPFCYKSFSNSSVAILPLSLWGNRPNSPMSKASPVPHRLSFFSQGRDLPHLGSCFQPPAPNSPSPGKRKAWFWPCFSASSTAHWFHRQTQSHHCDGLSSRDREAGHENQGLCALLCKTCLQPCQLLKFTAQKPCNFELMVQRT